MKYGDSIEFSFASLWPHVNLIRYTNQILEIENEDDVDDLTTACLVAIKIVMG